MSTRALPREAAGCRIRRIAGTGLAVALSAAFGFLLADATPAAAQQTGRVAGTVEEASTLEPLSGAQVSLRGTGLGGLTEENGQFSIRNVPAGSYTLEVRLIGFGVQTRQVDVTAGQTTTVEIRLQQKALEMEGIVVTGTAGGARRREIGNTVTQISSEEIENVPVTNVGDILTGRTPGLNILQASGQVGAGHKIRIRGNNTFGGNTPLVYVDGVRVNNLDSGAFEDEVNNSLNFLDNINPSDIARIEVVNGPSATTLYGTEAAGGVIQIFTKSGAGAETARWSAKIEQGVNSLPHVGPEIDDTELGLNCGLISPVPPGCPDSGSFVKNGHKQRYDASVRGGLQNFDYFLSGNWGRNHGVIDPQQSEQWGVRGNFGFQPNSALRLQFNNFYARRDITWIPDGNNAEGFLLNTFRGDAGYTPQNNNALTLEMGLDTHVDHVTSAVNVTWTPVSGLNQTLKAGIDYINSHYEEDKPWGFFYVPEGERESDSFLRRTLTLDYSGNYRSELMAGDLTSAFAWGGQLISNESKRFDMWGGTFSGPGPKLVEDGADRDIFDEDNLLTVEGGFFFQEQLGWQDVFFLTGGVRVDGNSSFGDDFGLEVYPKLQASYMLSDADFWPDWWETMKLRAAWGASGRAPGPFDKIRTWSSVSQEGRPGVTPGNPGDQDLGPERTSEWEGGFEATAFENRVSVSFTYFDQTTSDALVDTSPVPSNGFTSNFLQNIGELRNWGTETAVDFQVLRGQDLGWNLGFQYSTNESEAVDIGELPFINVGWRHDIREGYPVPVFVHDRVRNPDAPWDQIEFAEDSILGRAQPGVIWSVNTDVTIARRFSIKALGEYQGDYVMNSGTAYQNVRREAWPTCQYVLDAIESGNTSGLTAWDRGKCDPNMTEYGMWTEDASFFSLRQASVSYRIPERILPGGLNGATISLQARNLIKITDYPGVDPEAMEDGACTNCLYQQEYYNLPPLRTFVAMLNLQW